MAGKKVGVSVRLRSNCWPELEHAMKVVRERVEQVHGLDWEKDGQSRVSTKSSVEPDGISVKLELSWEENTDDVHAGTADQEGHDPADTLP